MPKRQGAFDASSVEHYLSAPVTPDLAAPSGPLEPAFPAPASGTQVVLYEAATDQLRLQWTLSVDDLLRAVSSFPTAGGSPVPTLQLARIHEHGGREVVVERPLRAARVGGQGEASFRVGADYGRFSVDLGLRNDDGGWLVLTRSNQLRRAGSAGLQFPIDPAVLAQHTRPDSAASVDGGSGSGPAGAGNAASHPGEMSPGVALRNWSAGDQQLGTDLSSGDGSPKRADDALSVERPPVAEGVDGTETGTPSQIPRLVYGYRTPAGVEFMLEAELHIHGCAAPNTEIELFGHQYRVGAGGRFQFVIKVDDPELLKRAFALRPPPGRNFTRDD